MLPQKKNPDVAELVRAKAGRLIGHLTGILATLKGLPLAYNRDLQEDKEPLFDALDQIGLALPAITGLMETSPSTSSGCDWLPTARRCCHRPGRVARRQGMPFRKAHGVVASLVRDSIQRGVTLEELVEAHPDLGEPALALLEPGVAVTRRSTPGGAGPSAVKVQLDRFRGRLEVDDRRLEDAATNIQRIAESHHIH